MQTEPILYAVEARVVSDTVDGQHQALLDTIMDLPHDYKTLTNDQWRQVFGLYWGLRQLMGPDRWRKWWQRIKRYRQGPPSPEECNADLWCWLEDARDWRREQARTQSGTGKRRWKTLQKSPRKHADHKQRNREAQRRRRARLQEGCTMMPESADATVPADSIEPPASVRAGMINRTSAPSSEN